MNKLDSLGSLQRELQHALGIEQDVPTSHISRYAIASGVVGTNYDQGMGLLEVLYVYIDKPEYDPVYPRIVDMSELCVGELVFPRRTLMFATTTAKGSWPHGTACAMVRIGRNECYQGFAQTSNSKMQFQATRTSLISLARQDWLCMDCHDC